jgi:hypothetical protein
MARASPGSENGAVKRIPSILAVSATLVIVGMAGAWAFNPDDGAVWHAEPLWRIFGIGVYLGVAAFWLTVLAAPFVLVVSACRRRHP